MDDDTQLIPESDEPAFEEETWIPVPRKFDMAEVKRRHDNAEARALEFKGKMKALGIMPDNNAIASSQIMAAVNALVEIFGLPTELMDMFFMETAAEMYEGCHRVALQMNQEEKQPNLSVARSRIVRPDGKGTF